MFSKLKAIVSRPKNHEKQKMISAMLVVDDALDSTARKLYSYIIALESMGVYPKSSTSPEGVTRERSEREEGWNDAILSYTKATRTVYEALKRSGLKKLKAGELYKLIDDNIVGVNIVGESIKLYLILNDVFMHASSDEEDIEPWEVEGIYNVYTKYGHTGIAAYASEKRNESLPILNLITYKFREAKKYIRQNALLTRRQDQ
jgi:hypothetical protein